MSVLRIARACATVSSSVSRRSAMRLTSRARSSSRMNACDGCSGPTSPDLCVTATSMRPCRSERSRLRSRSREAASAQCTSSMISTSGAIVEMPWSSAGIASWSCSCVMVSGASMRPVSAAGSRRALGPVTAPRRSGSKWDSRSRSSPRIGCSASGTAPAMHWPTATTTSSPRPSANSCSSLDFPIPASPSTTAPRGEPAMLIRCASRSASSSRARPTSTGLVAGDSMRHRPTNRIGLPDLRHGWSDDEQRPCRSRSAVVVARISAGRADPCRCAAGCAWW